MNFSDYKLRIIREKAFLISQVLEEANVEPGALALGLDGFRKLLTEVKKPRDPNDSGLCWVGIIELGRR
jgi:hypothetical protein